MLEIQPKIISAYLIRKLLQMLPPPFFFLIFFFTNIVTLATPLKFWKKAAQVGNVATSRDVYIRTVPATSLVWCGNFNRVQNTGTDLFQSESWGILFMWRLYWRLPRSTVRWRRVYWTRTCLWVCEYIVTDSMKKPGKLDKVFSLIKRLCWTCSTCYDIHVHAIWISVH